MQNLMDCTVSCSCALSNLWMSLFSIHFFHNPFHVSRNFNKLFYAAVTTQSPPQNEQSNSDSEDGLPPLEENLNRLTLQECDESEEESEESE